MSDGNDRLNEISDRLSRLVKDVATGFNHLDERVASLEDQFGQFDKRLSTFQEWNEGRLEEIIGRLDVLDGVSGDVTQIKENVVLVARKLESKATISQARLVVTDPQGGQSSQPHHNPD